MEKLLASNAASTSINIFTHASNISKLIEGTIDCKYLIYSQVN